MFVAGVKPAQYLWCEMRGAYSGQRVQLFDKQCKGYKPRAQPIQKLNLSRNPKTNRPLDTQKRRMTVRDAGLTQGWDLQGSPDATSNLYASVAKLAVSYGATSVDIDASCLDEHLMAGMGDLSPPFLLSYRYHDG